MTEDERGVGIIYAKLANMPKTMQFSSLHHPPHVRLN